MQVTFLPCVEVSLRLHRVSDCESKARPHNQSKVYTGRFHLSFKSIQSIEKGQMYRLYILTSKRTVHDY